MIFSFSIFCLLFFSVQVDATPTVSGVSATYDDNLTSSYTLGGTADRAIIDWKLGDSSFSLVNLPFEGGSNSTWTKDYSSYSNNATVVGDATYGSTTGYDGNGSYYFDGGGNQESVRVTGLTIPQNYSVSFWANRQASSGLHPYFSFSKTVLLKVSSSNIYWGGMYLCHSPSNSEWHHFTLVVENGAASQAVLYVDGELCGTGANYLTPTANLYLGSITTLVNDNWNGYIDDFKIFGRPLSQEQIQSIFQDGFETIVSEELVDDEEWTLEVTPNNGTVDGLSVESSSVTIGDAPTPEFSDYAMILLLMTTVGGFIYFRKQDD